MAAMRIVLAEDSVLLREGLVRLLAELGHQTVACVGDGPSAVEAVSRLRPDLFITDVRMPPTNSDDGLRAAVALRSTQPALPVLVLSQYVEAPYARKLLEGGGRHIGYLLKHHVEDIDSFGDSLTTIAAGGTVIDPEVIAQLMVRRTAAERLESLSTREREVLTLIASGKTNLAIAEQLVISLGAVEKHIANIFAKLDLPVSREEHRRVLAVLTWLQQ